MLKSPVFIEIPSIKVFETPEFHPFSVKFSPFRGDLLAVAASRNFGLKGSGRLFILQLIEIGTNGALHQSPSSRRAETIKVFDFHEGLFDVCWSESCPDILIVGGGEGIIYQINFRQAPPPTIISAPTKSKSSGSVEISSLDWCPRGGSDKFIASSWDGCIKLFSGQGFVKSFTSDSAAVINEVRWHPSQVNIFASASSKPALQLWDDRTNHQPTLHLFNSATTTSNIDSKDILTVDWNKYEDWQVATGDGTGSLTFWDIRRPAQPVLNIPSAHQHRRPVKRVRFSPWRADQLASIGFDMAVRVWNPLALNPWTGANFQGYSEFAAGLDWSNFERGLLASCSWDQGIHLHFL